jgi:hypothetical protein
MRVLGHQYVAAHIAADSRCGVAQFVEVARAVNGRQEAGAAVVAALRPVLRHAGQVDARLSWLGVGRLDPMPMLDVDARLRDEAFDGLGVGEPLHFRHHSRHSDRHIEATHTC